MGPARSVYDEMVAAAVAYATAEAERVLALAKADVPVGDPAEDPNPAVSLADTGRVDVDVDRGRVTASITFNTPYAVKQHESSHLQHPRGGRRNFLGTHVQQAAGTFAAGLARAIQSRTVDLGATIATHRSDRGLQHRGL